MAPRIIDLDQSTSDWKNWRRSRIGASDIATIMCLNPWQSPMMLYAQKMSGEDIEESHAMKEGKRKEPLARACAERHFGCSYPPICIQHKDYEYFIASLDGYNPGQRRRILEIKCPGEKHHQTAKLGVICSHWYPQTQWQLFCDGSDEMEFMSYMSDDDYEIITVKRDDGFIEKAKIAAEAFYRCLVDFIPPEPTDMDLIELCSPIANEAAKIIYSANQIIKEQENLIEEAKAALKKESEGKSCRVGDHRFVKYYRKGAIDYLKIPAIAEMPSSEIEKYRKQKSESWRFS